MANLLLHAYDFQIASKSLPQYSNALNYALSTSSVAVGQMQVNPKIDGSQRRLQCSVRFDDFFKHLAQKADSSKQEQPKVFGVPVPRQFASAPRTIIPEKK